MTASHQITINTVALKSSLQAMDRLIAECEKYVRIDAAVEPEDLARAREACHQVDRLCRDVLKRIPVPAVYDGFTDVWRGLSIEDDEMQACVDYLKQWRRNLEEYADLYFPGEKTAQFLAERTHLVTMCERISESAKVLRHRTQRSTGPKAPFEINDEYDVQDLLQAVIKGSIACTVVEEPLGKVAGVTSSRADIAVAELGTLIEIKYARNVADQKLFVKAFSEDLTLYPKWAPLEFLIFLVYNSHELQDAEALAKEFNGMYERGGKRFQVLTVLS